MTNQLLQQLLSQPPRIALGTTVWAEGRSEHVEVRIGILDVIRHRLMRWKEFEAVSGTYQAVCLAPEQFSCWNDDGSKNHQAVVAAAAALVAGGTFPDPVLTECLGLADGLLGGWLLTRLPNVVFYAETALLLTNPPEWLKPGMPETKLGSLTFFAEAA